ncbi:MAG: FkbM family methyltransferase [Bacteroidota bacterium]
MNFKLFKRKLLNKGALWLSYIKLIPILSKLDKNSVVIDCGANVGHITNKFAGTGATVHAFEPDPIAYKILQSRFKNSPNIFLHQKGVWDKESELSFYTHKDQEAEDVAYTVGSSIIGNKVNVDQGKKQIIQVINLSDFIKKLGKVNVIKLDVEGAETAILFNILKDETYKLFDMMYVETHETKIPGQAEELTAIRKIMAEKNVTNIKLNWL